jgi:hypothetical protein
MGLYREVENLYLLIALSEIGKEYWLPQATLASHFRLEYREAQDTYEREEFLSHFSITVLISYIKNKVRYAKLRAFVEAHAIKKLTQKKAQCPNDAEAILLFLDLIVCPFVSNQTKAALASVFDLDAAELAAVQSSNDRWFTTWGDDFNLGKELDAKRSREVY